MGDFTIKDTCLLIEAIERIKKPASYILDTVFPQIPPVALSTQVAIEYRKAGRVLAPFVTKGTTGRGVSRFTSQMRLYSAPMLAPRRVIGLADIESRQFGEQPVFSTITPEERAAKMQANDLLELLGMLQNRKNKMAAEILQTGTITIEGYADDGRTIQSDIVEFVSASDCTMIPQTKWSTASAKIYSDLKNASETIQENSGFIPTLLICGKNIEGYLLNNTEMKNWLSIPNRENLNLASFAPHFVSPQARFIGFLSALNLEIISYNETYLDATGASQPYIDPDNAILCVPGRGKQLYGAVTLLEGENWRTYSAQSVPHYYASEDAQQSSLTIYSRCLLAPETAEDFICIKALQ